MSPYLHHTVAVSHDLHHAHVLRRHQDSHWQSEGLDNFWPPNIVEDEETVGEMARKEQPGEQSLLSRAHRLQRTYFLRIS